MKRQDAIKAVGLLAAAYRESLTKETIEAYAGGLLDLPPDATLEAVKDLINCGGPFFPRISEIRARVAETLLALPTVEEEASEIVRLAQEHGPSWETPIFRNDLQASAVQAVGGWETLASGFQYVLPAFRQAYERLRTERVQLVQREGMDAVGRASALPWPLLGGLDELARLLVACEAEQRPLDIGAWADGPDLLRRSLGYGWEAARRNLQAGGTVALVPMWLTSDTQTRINSAVWHRRLNGRVNPKYRDDRPRIWCPSALIGGFGVARARLVQHNDWADRFTRREDGKWVLDDGRRSLVHDRDPHGSITSYFRPDSWADGDELLAVLRDDAEVFRLAASRAHASEEDQAELRVFLGTYQAPPAAESALRAGATTEARSRLERPDSRWSVRITMSRPLAMPALRPGSPTGYLPEGYEDEDL